MRRDESVLLSPRSLNNLLLCFECNMKARGPHVIDRHIILFGNCLGNCVLEIPSGIDIYWWLECERECCVYGRLNVQFPKTKCLSIKQAILSLHYGLLVCVWASMLLFRQRHQRQISSTPSDWEWQLNWILLLLRERERMM